MGDRAERAARNEESLYFLANPCLIFSHIIIPYLIIKIPVFWDPLFLQEICILTGLFFFGVSGQIVHELIDDEAISKYSLRTVQIIILICSSIALVFFVLLIILSLNYLFIPIVLAPIGTIYKFRRKNRPPKTLKNVGIIVGNLLMVYLIILMFAWKLFMQS